MNIKFEDLKQLFYLARAYHAVLIKDGKIKEAQKIIPLLDRVFNFILIVTVEKREKELEAKND